VAEMYPPGYQTWVDVTELGAILEGEHRPSHFRGVATICVKLFNVVRPDLAYFGQKDAQQALVIRHMVADLNLALAVRVHPTVREPDGLAMSSRNRYLDPAQRLHATSLHRALRRAEELVAAGERSVPVLERAMTDVLTAAPGTRLDYARVLDADTLDTVPVVRRPVLAAVAVFFGATRLIDNTILTP
jgi:pantoate--beta-alanine ligase